MKITKRAQHLIRFQQIVFYALLIAAVVLLSQLSISTNKQFDWTQNHRHTLSDTSLTILHNLKDSITIQVFVSPDYEYRSAIVELLQRYQQHSDKLKIQFVDPSFSPDIVRQFNIQQQGEMVISRDEQNQHVFDLSEQSLTNAVVTVSRQSQPWLVFIEGHSERSPYDKSDFGLDTLAKNLESQGIKIRSQNLLEAPELPDNTAALVIASPEKDWLPGEIKIVRDYLDKGGNLLWLADPTQTKSLAPLAEQLGIEFVQGTVLDPNSSMLGIQDPRFVLITDYANHPVGQAVKSVTLLAEATAMQKRDENTESPWHWHYINLLNSQPNAWVESTPITQANLSQQKYNEGADVSGPVSLGMLIDRDTDKDDSQQQRVAVIGDADFVANSYIGNAANLDLGMALINWLVEDDGLISIPIKTSIGTQLTLSKTQSIIIGFGFLFAVPLLLLTIGLTLWWRRKRR
ncbi:GldG family protein [Methylophaga thalassica]|uniref:GldG family protein n=1 Tax=Methylophaga aminisulfidivorans TaxID=230105 RepID=UPI003A95A47E